VVEKPHCSRLMATSIARTRSRPAFFGRLMQEPHGRDRVATARTMKSDPAPSRLPFNHDTL
jgi:hypothetical protein